MIGLKSDRAHQKMIERLCAQSLKVKQKSEIDLRGTISKKANFVIKQKKGLDRKPIFKQELLTTNYIL